MPNLLQDKKLIGREIAWLETLRSNGREAFEKQGIPTAKNEAWKYTKPRDLSGDDFVVDSPVSSCHCEASSSPCHCEVSPSPCHCEVSPSSCHCEEQRDAAITATLPFSCYEIHFSNGVFNPEISKLPAGVEVFPLIEAILFNHDTRLFLGKLLDVEKHPFGALNNYYLNEGVFIRVEKNVSLKKPIALINHTEVGQENLFYNLRNLLILEDGASAEFVEYYHYEGDVKSRYFVNIVNEIFVGKNAKLSHYKFQNEAFKANHIALNIAEVKAGGIYNSFCLQKGANIGRNETKVLLTAEQAKTQVNVAYLMNGWATLDTTTNIEHLSAYTFSEQLVKGVVGGDARGVFQGKIHIAPHAVKTEGKQTHRALLLSDTAEIDCKPELEIFADDVKCSHGAASGELDEEQLFYMQSRGISREEAKQILIDAYLDDVVNHIENEEIRCWIKSNV